MCVGEDGGVWVPISFCVCVCVCVHKKEGDILFSKGGGSMA